MRHPNREKLEGGLSRRMGRLNASLRAELRQLMGTPPNPNRVPPQFWDKAQREIEAEVIAALYLIFLANESWHAEESGAPDDVLRELQSTFDATAADYAARRGAAAADSYANTARRRFDEAAQAAEREAAEATAAASALEAAQREAARKAAEHAYQEAIDDAIEKALSDARAESLAVTETTSAQTAGGDAGASYTTGITGQDVWSTHPERSKTGPCPRCAALHGVPREQWALIDLPDEGHDGDPADGPPLGPGCQCEILYANLGQLAGADI